MDTRRILGTVLVAGGLVAGATAGPASPAAAAAGSYGGAYGTDPYYPRQGNGGYAAVSYSLHIAYTPSTRRLSGDVGMHASAKIALSRFDLDLRRNLVVSSVTVDGRPARFSQPASLVQELVITPAQVIPAGRAFTVRVRYAGTAHYITDPGGGIDGITATSDGAVVVSEPQGAPTWFPVNDTPTDKAVYAMTFSVPQNLDTVSNGEYLGRSIANGRTTSRWRITQPISSYLVTMAIGRWTFTGGTTPGGIPYLNAADPAQPGAAGMLRQIPGIVDWYAKLFGRYPFGQTGGIVENAPFLGYSLETASRPVYDKTPSLLTLSHEQAHQWFGDSVSVARWRDIWLNEGFAEFASWVWDEHVGRKSAAQHYRDVMSVPASNTSFWNPPPGNPGSASKVFAGSVYQRGAATLQALRAKLGSALFFSILRGWLAAHHYGNARVEQFTAYAEARAHRDLTPFFTEWLYRSGKPRV